MPRTRGSKRTLAAWTCIRLVIVMFILFSIVGQVFAFLVTGVSIFYLAKKAEYQWPEASHDLDMVKELPKGNVRLCRL